MRGVIYKYTFPNGKVYVGQTRQPLEMRHKQHISPVSGPLNPGFWEAYKEFGTVDLEVIETIDTTDGVSLVRALNNRETYYISVFKATNPEYGYNIRTTGTSNIPDNRILLEEFYRLLRSVEKQVQSDSSNLYDKIVEGNPSTLTDDERKFIDTALFDNNLFDNALNEMFNQETLEVKNDNGLFFLEEALDYVNTIILDELKEDIAAYINKNATSIIRKAKEGNEILQIDKDGVVVKEFFDADEIRQAFNIVRIDNITNVLKGKQKTAYGFFWRYKNQKENNSSQY